MSGDRLSDEDLTVLVERGAAGSWASTFGASTDLDWENVPGDVKNSYRESVLPAIFHGTKALRDLGWVKPRIITTHEELDALPSKAVILDGDGDLHQRDGDHWYAPKAMAYCRTDWLMLPATVLHEPEATA